MICSPIVLGASYTKLIVRCCRANRQLSVDWYWYCSGTLHLIAMLHMWIVSSKPCEQVQKFQSYKGYWTRSDVVAHFNFLTFRCPWPLLLGTARNSILGKTPERNKLLVISSGLFGTVWYTHAVNATGSRQQSKLNGDDSQRVCNHFMLPGHET